MAVNNRITTQEAETILWQILNGSSELKSMISGNIYKEGFRPTNSGLEDISINTINLTQDNPQIGLHNINIYTQAIKKEIACFQEEIPDSVKLRSFAEKVKTVIDLALKDVKYKDFAFRIQVQQTFENEGASPKEFYQNMRVQLIIPQQ